MVRVVAETDGVCVRPLVRQVLDRETGLSVTVALPCGSTRESRCPSCAKRARWLRMQQCRDGWHLCEEPEPPAAEPSELASDEPVDNQDADTPTGAPGSSQSEGERRVRSTSRVAGFPDLPAVPMAHATIGRSFVDPVTGATFRPSMFLTLTLPSYGRVRDGVPVDPGSYDYRRAALDALLFPRLLDRFWQNLRRCAGYKVQYFSAIEAQRRLAAHLHAAVRGAIPRATVKAVVRATYYAAWWPSIDQVAYDGDRIPVWHRESGQYVDPDTGEVLPTWEQALDQVEEPVHVVSFGTQVDIKGILGGSSDSARAVRYLCKYLTKTIAATYTPDSDGDREPGAGSAVQRHIDRLHQHIRVLPCSPACANWLRYGVQPANPTPGLVPGRCPSPAHDRENLGLGGRRVLVSRAWTGKTLTEHRADRRAVVAQVLEAAGVPTEDAARMATHHTMPDGRARYVWKDVPAGELDYVSIMLGCIRHARHRREQYETAKAQLATHGPPAGPVDNRSATGTAA
jgi:hypothetical protein